ncbi:MAG: alpha/beta fold hydrolase [Myxococcota bacterium]|jgi:pimeloyl-ACP methyl ester carboxylesterase|nr:alpha/beta fold hydrolase [Myxococcota bacterium]
MERQTFFVPNGAGWELCCKRSLRRDSLRPGWPPVVIVPGYGMNAYLFGYHPRGPSMIDCWVERGHEVWTVELRGQGSSVRRGGRRDYGLADLARVDLPAALSFVRQHTLTGSSGLHAVGCSLGGTLLYAHVACRAAPALTSLVALGAPLRWEQANPLFRLGSEVPGLARLVGHLSTREAARRVLPLLVRAPRLLAAYLHPALVDLSDPDRLFLAVDGLHPRINAEFGRWLRTRDLVLDGCDVGAGWSTSTVPLLCVIGAGDGIVPEAAALSALARAGAPGEVLRVGDRRRPYAHADLFVANDAPADLFLPVARWLEVLSGQVATTA